MLSIRALGNGAKPQVVRIPRPPIPIDGSSQAQIKVIGAGLHHVVRSRASGEHYSVSGAPKRPGIDGTGINLKTGKAVYFITPPNEDGSFAEFVNVPTPFMWDIPEGADPVQVAGLMNPLLSSWLALRKRVDFLRQGKQDGWSCLVMGVTSISGRLAVQVARHFGAAKVLGAARREATPKDLSLDDYIVLKDPPETTDFTPAADANVTLDYLYGPYVRAFLQGTQSKVPLTWVSIGKLTRLEAEIPSQELRRRDLTLRGSGVGSWDPRDAMKEIPEMLQLIRDVKMGDITLVGIEDAEQVWDVTDKRVVFVTSEYSNVE
ncbi:hypothetical protein F4805DRAFT_18958 [Annulohypoxylon moriforme]|nr:hypothetical protein F4805DRAFT_18958 [Annulohypoxylon moriforme]